MAKGPEVAIFGGGPAAIWTAKKLQDKLDCGLTILSPDSPPGQRSVYATSSGAPELEQLPPGLTRDLDEIRVVTQQMDFVIPTGNRYFMVDYPRFVGISLASLAKRPGIRIERFPQKVISDIAVADLKKGVLLRIDGQEGLFDLAVDCTGIKAEILRIIDPSRRDEDFLVEYIFGGKYRGELAREQMILVNGPGGGNSWICPSVEDGFVDVVFSGWGPYGAFKDKFLPSASARLGILLQYALGLSGIHFDSLAPEAIFSGMIGSQRILPPLSKSVYGLGESIRMALPATGDIFRRLPSAAELLAKTVSQGRSPREFYQAWREKSGMKHFFSGDDFFLAAALVRLPHQATSSLGGTMGRAFEIFGCQGKIDEKLKHGLEKWIIEHQVDPQTVLKLLEDPIIRKCFSEVLLKRMEILFRGPNKIPLPYTLPDV